MARKKQPELTFQTHVADYLVRVHKYGVLEQTDITDTEHFWHSLFEPCPKCCWLINPFASGPTRTTGCPILLV